MSQSAAQPPPAVFTVGHSTRSIADFLELLHAHGVTRLLDVRTVPRSRYNPQFNRDTLPGSDSTIGSTMPPDVHPCC